MSRCSPISWRSLLLALVTLSLLSGLASVAGQGSGGSGEAEPTAARDSLVLTDPRGDPGFFGVGAPADTPAGAALQHIDILRFAIDNETAASVDMSIQLAGFDAALNGITQAGSLGGIQCSVWFTYEGTAEGDLDYTLSFSAWEIGPMEEPQWTSRLAYRYWGDGSQTDDTRTFPYTWDGDAHTLRATLPKTFIPVYPGGHTPRDGDTLVLRSVDCSVNYGIYGHFEDWVRLDPARFGFSSPGPGDVVRLSRQQATTPPAPAEFTFPDLASDTITVPPGEQTVISLRVQNMEDKRHLVLFEAGAERDPADVRDWNLTITPSIILKSGESRGVNLIVTPPAEAEMGQIVLVRVAADPAGANESGVVTLPLRVAPTLAPDQNVIHLHARPSGGGFFYVGDVTMFPTYDLALSLLADEPGYTNEPLELAPLFARELGASLAPLAKDVLLSEDDATWKVGITGEADAVVAIELWVGDEEGTLYQKTVDVGPGQHEFPLLPMFDGNRLLKQGSQIDMTMTIRRSMDDPTTIYLDPASTGFTLPVRAHKGGLVVTDGRFLPNLDLDVDEDDLAYLNPGKQYAFDLVLSNDGIESDDLTVHVAAENATGWDVRVLPGERFRIPAGNATPLTVEVTAGPDVTVDQAATFVVTATSRHDDAARATLVLEAIATNAAELESKPYAAKEGELDPLEETVRESPASALLPVVLVSALGAWTTRRLRTVGHE